MSPDSGIPYWELSRDRQVKLLRGNLLEVLFQISDRKITPDDFAQELAQRLSALPEPVLFVNERFKGASHRSRFQLAQKKAFLELIAPYRCRKRGERIVSFSDPRWRSDTDAPHGRRLQRHPREFRHHGPEELIENSAEREQAALLDLIRCVLDEYPEPVVLAAMGHLSQIEAARQLGVRNTTAVGLIREAKSALHDLGLD